MSGVTAVVLAMGDKIPDAAVNWANVSGVTPQANADQSLTGITPLYIRATITGYSNTGAVGSGSLRIFVGGVEVSSVTAAEAATVDAYVTAGQNIHFEARKGGAGTGTNWQGTVTVIIRDTGYPLDSFTVSVDSPP